MSKGIFIIVTSFLLMLTACLSGDQIMTGDDMFRSYTRILQDEAKKMVEWDDGHIIVDVRRPDELSELS